MAELYLVEFKGSRREFFFNSYYHTLKPDDLVIVQAERGEDAGMLRNKVDAEIDFGDQGRPRSILRRASDDDIAAVEELREKETVFKSEVVQMVAKHGLAMKIVDVECQYDGNKMTIFFTADHRVDFRELVKELASCYRTRIELRQIGVRDEARRIGGYGICGLRQCCNTFIREFEPISTQHARDQDLPLNPAKISGNCGRLLCCLRYESDMYTECKRRFPAVGAEVKTKGGDSGVIERIDVLREEAVIRGEEGRRFSCPAGSLAASGSANEERPNAGKRGRSNRHPKAADQKASDNKSEEQSRRDSNGVENEQE
jgi:cell fate regulator YaaT (PSP1 superfamily)